MKPTVILCLIFAFFKTTSFSQETWSLEKCITYALENNIQIKQEKLNTEYYKNNFQQSRAEMLPSLNASADQNYVFGRSVDPYTNEINENNYQSANFNINSQLTLFNGFRIKNTIGQNKFNMLSGLQNLEKIKNDVSLNIATAYLQILFANEQLDISQKQLEVTRQQIERTKKMVDAGNMARGNLLEIEAQAANEELQLINNKNNLSSSILTLKQLLDLEENINFEISIPDLTSIPIVPLADSVETIYKMAIALPQIKSAEYRVEASEKQLEVAKSGYYPSLSLMANYYTGYSDQRKKAILGTSTEEQIGYVTGTNTPVMTMMPQISYGNYAFGEQLSDNASRYLIFRLSIPIFNQFQVKTSVSNSKIARQNSQFNLQIAQNQLYKDIQQSLSDANAAYARYYGSLKATESMEESFKYTQQKFDLGLLNSVDYNLAKTNLAKAKSESVQARFEYIFKTRILEFYKGNPIRL